MPINTIFEQSGQILGGVVLGGILFLAVLVGFFVLVKMFLRISAPNEALVFSGGFQKSKAEGQTRNYRVLIGGRKLYIPFVTRVDRLSLALMEVPITIRNAYSSGGIPMNVDAIANVKISSDQEVVGNAVERFLNRDLNEVRRVAKETLEGHLRGVVATLTPEQVNEDRLVFADALAKETEEDLRKLGMHLDTLKILHVSDEVAYLDSTSRKAIANVVRAAEIAESDARRLAEQGEAENTGRGNVTRANAESEIARLRNQLRTVQAELAARVNAEEEKTTAAAREARARAEQELQSVRSKLEAIRLQADQVLPAEAERQAAELRARAQAAYIRERGRATSEALSLVHEAWKEAGASAKQIALIEDLEKILAAACKGVSKLQVETIHVIDSGDGKTLPNYVAAYPEILNTVFDAVKATTGIDVPGSVAGEGGKK